jgi:hypothetical protein
MQQDTEIPAVFVNHAAEILAETRNGLSGSEIVNITTAHAVDCNVDLPHPSYPFDVSNKRKALYENLLAFPSPERYRVIRSMCDHKSIQARSPEAANELKLKLITKYGHFADTANDDNLDKKLIDETRHWLSKYPESLSLYDQAMLKRGSSTFARNLLDDLRLSLEKLLQSILKNGKSLENQLSALGDYIKQAGGSTELQNMLVKLIDYYCKYNNTYVKHDDAVVDHEIEVICEITSCFMRHLVRIHARIAS